jgi:hypothetical protein
MKNVQVLCAAVVSSALVGCKEQPPTTPPPTGADGAALDANPEAEADADPQGAAAGQPGQPGVPWADKDAKARQQWMVTAVMPKMKAMFKAHDEANFQGFKCQTCHGDDMKAKKFAMPSDSIYALDPKRPVEAAMEYDEDVTKFMVEQVVPEMAALLDTTPLDPATGQGLGCFSCHPSE